MESIEQAKTQGDAAFRSKHHELAIAAYSRALELCEQQQNSMFLCVLYSNRAAAKLALQDYQGALADAQQSVAVDDRWVKGWFRSAKALQGLGKLQQALQAANRAQQLEPDNKDVRLLVQQLQQQAQHASPQQLNPQPEPSQQEQQQQSSSTLQLPWRELNQRRSRLDLKGLPKQLVAGSRYIPSPDGTNQNLLLLLHGLGDTPAGFTALAQRMALPQTACLALSGPQAVPETDGGRAWFTTFEQDGELIQPRPRETRRTASLAATLQRLQRLLFEVLPAVGGWRPGQVQLLGFSQGGCVCLELARSCRGDRQLGGVVAVSAGLLPETLTELGGSTGNTAVAAGDGSKGSPVLVTYGDKDGLIDRERVDRSVSVLRAAGCEVQLKVLPGKAHAMISSEEEMRCCMGFWAKRLQHRPADDSFEEVS